MEKKVIWLGLVAAAMLTGCSEQKQEAGAVHSVMLVQPEGTGSESVKTFSGVIEEGREISVGFKTPGQLARIAVKEGQYIKAGQLVAVLDDKDYKLGVEAAQIQYDQLKGEVARLKQLHDANSLSGNDYEKAVAGLGQVGVSLQSNKNKLEYTRLYAPTSGYVQSVNFEASEMVDAGTPVITLLDVHQMEVSINIPASLYLQKDRITGYTCKGAFDDGAEIPLRLISITPKADNNQLYKVRLAMTRIPSTASAGMNVEVAVNLLQGESKGQTILPLHAVFQKDGKSCVWVFNPKDSTVNVREVMMAGTEGGNALIATGLDGTEQVVKAGVNALQDKERVKVIEKPTKTNVGGMI